MSRKSSPSFAPESFRCCQKPTAEWYVNTGGIEHWQVIAIPSLYSNFCYDTTYMILCKDMYLPLYPWTEWFGCPYKTLCSACFFLSPKLLSACQLSPYIGFFQNVMWLKPFHFNTHLCFLVSPGHENSFLFNSE